MLFDNGNEVIQDYGLARFVNIEQKYGGGYLPENTSWAKQSIAHNTIIFNKRSHFNGDYKTGNQFHSDRYFLDLDNNDIQIVSAKETNAYPETELHRTMALINDPEFERPVVLDLFRINSESINQYDLPYYFLGQVISLNFDFTNKSHLAPMGTGSGYQHLWLEGTGVSPKPNTKLSWLANQRFYTLTTLTSKSDSLLFGRIGANDPEFNLRRDPVFIVRKRNINHAVFASIIEIHGHYDPVSEIASNASGNIENLDLIINNDKYTCLSFKSNKGTEWILLQSNLDADEKSKHTVKIGGEKYKWQGPYKLIKH
jgi:hypothetical protein